MPPENLHFPVEEDELPQRTPFEIAVTIQYYKNKRGADDCG
ncbi:MAG: hypothetical protein O8C66_04280 [Candidatus Methanoperedens sp.]|nr:hypothetical protein [Candidatus Methanoperedens sp.]MCZ7369705.1 hypothetical protein [Candidatus Methanoperedens sp.]